MNMAPIDRWLPEFDVHELHDIHVAAPPETAFAAALGIPVAPDALVRTLFRLRGLPAGGSLEGAMRAIGFLPRSFGPSHTSSAPVSPKSSSSVYAISTRRRLVTSSGSPGASSCTAGG